MRLGTSTNLLFGRPDGTRVPLEKTLELVSEAGFRVFDLNFYDWSLPGSVFLTDDWQYWIEGVALKASQLKIEFGQCHGYFFDFLNPALSDDEYEYHKKLQQRSLECCQIVKGKVCVLHPETDRTAIDYEKKSFQSNRQYYEPLLEEAEKKNLKIAIENMCDYGIAPKRKYCADPAQLVEFVASFNSDRIGICWDFEHADIMAQDQRQSLQYIKEYLIATHVSDTYSKTDNTLMHVLPMTGTIDWHKVMVTLKEINYQGDFCYEVHNYINKLPDPAIPAALKLAYQVGQYLMTL